MKRRLTFYAAIMLCLLIANASYSQNPTYILNCTNRTPLPSVVNSVEWDLDMTWTNSGVVPNYEYAGGQFFFDLNPGIANGGTVTMSNVGSDMPVNMQPRNPTVYSTTTPWQLRWAVNTFPGAGSGFPMPAGVPITIVRIRLQTTAATFAPVAMNLTWRNALPNPFTKIFAYVGTTNTDISTPPTHIISFSNDPLLNGIYANFYSNVRTVSYGQTVNFLDSTLGSPTNWAWTFTGGTPSSSTAQNPTNIRYNTPGIYPVKLIASKSGYSDTITKTNYITVTPLPCVPVWLQMIRLSDAGNINDSLYYGVAPQGTNGIDTCLGEQVLPPPPPTGVFDCRFQLTSPDDSKRDIRSDTITYNNWYIKFQPSSAGYPITFTWNPAALPTTGFFNLKDVVNGTIVNINMRNQGSYVLTNTGLTSLRIEFLNKRTIPVSVNPFWNMLSVPLLSDNMHVTSLFPGCYLPAYGYDNGYVTATNLDNGKGYWVQFENAGTYPIYGIPPTSTAISVVQGWNIIGPFDENIPVNRLVSNPPGIVISPYYGFNYGYVTADTLKVGKGYWVRTSAAGTLTRSITNNPENTPVLADNLNNWTRIEIADNGGNKSSLYLANANSITSSFDLPPVPPSGIFDVRFGTETSVEAFGQNHQIKLNSATHPLKIKAYNLGGIKLRLTDGVNGAFINRELEEGVEIIINENFDNFVLIEENLIPKTYDLSQNYPNPFNPVTTIKYQIPEAGSVNLVIYDILGREISTLVNTFQAAGYYEMRFDATDVASGVYFYRLKTEKFSDLKKMIILK
ncbi:MAG: T9SS type A sorting domain-containing protein [Ignavibacteria bacterium]|nr:T9SS type A sorting domain-containing protein [Ignavibacteria bacterium]